MSKNYYLDFHVLQTVPPSCINRDDTGSPKTAVFGGKTRARVSSQAWKHAMRINFKDYFSEDEIGFRTRKVSALLVKELLDLKPEMAEEKAEKTAKEVLKEGGVLAGDDKKDVLFFISRKQIKSLAKLTVDLDGQKVKDKEKKEIYKKALYEDPSIDIALFGRMAANEPSLNYDASAQVAHAISTHAISNEYDYFTAVDDYSTDEESGAGHLGTVEFNSSTLYRYATVNVNVLCDNLDTKEIGKAIRGFAKAFLLAMPTGKQNTFANKTLPDLVYVTIREDQPINFANAFEKPVTISENGYLAGSKKAFSEYARNVYQKWDAEPKTAWVVGDGFDGTAQNVTFNELIEELVKTVEEDIKNRERVG